MEQLDAMRFFAIEIGGISGPIPSSYGNLNSLLLLDFDFNQLTGTITDSLWSLTNLRQLDLNDNRLEGTLSEDIGNLRQLRFFQIDNNNMVGLIPSALGDIPNFSLIGLSGNDFQGAMPDEVCDLRPSPLQTLVVDCDSDCEIPQCCTSCVPNQLTSALEDTPSIPAKRESHIGFKNWLVSFGGSRDSRSGVASQARPSLESRRLVS